MKDELFELNADEIAAVNGGTTEESSPTTERGGKYVLAGG